jgi:hypothetical protein
VKATKMLDMESKKNPRGAGRHPVPEHKRRIPCHSLRLKAYWVYWLKQHTRVGGRMIEEALRGYFAPNEKKIIEEFYQGKDDKDD